MKDNNKPEWMKRVKQSIEDFNSGNTDSNNFIDNKLVLEEGIDTKVRFIEVDKLQDAPKEWNRFKPLTYDKFESLKDSIEEEGLLHPIYVWKYKDDYIVISGHNRKRAYQELYNKTKDKKYKKISATILIVNKLDEKKAKKTIEISNIQRDIF
jgi:ParB family chromosome partitioning protein